MSEDDSIIEVKRRARRAAILGLIRRGGAVSRGDIAQRMRLQMPTVTHLVAGLMAEGLVKEDGHIEAERGRRSARLIIDPASVCVVGLHVNPGGVVGAMVSLRGDIAPPARVRGPLPPETLADGLCTALAGAAESAGLLPERLRGVGVCADGYPPETLRSAAETLSAAFGAPVRFEVDVDAAAVGYAWFSEEACRSVLFAHFGDRIRSGLTVDGLIHRGAVAGLGLGLGVVEEREGGGTLQSLASGEAVCEAVRREVGRGIRTKLPDLVGGDLTKLTLRTVIDAAGAGDILAFNVLDRAGRLIGDALAWAVCAVNPERLVLAGELVRAGGPLTDAIRHEVSTRIPPAWEVERRLVFAPSDEETFLRGAAALALRGLFGQDDREAAICV